MKNPPPSRRALFRHQQHDDHLDSSDYHRRLDECSSDERDGGHGVGCDVLPAFFLPSSRNGSSLYHGALEQDESPCSRT
eukprot:CAMPEP_0185251906 /NCGR_PEP_ID=MMETSP1359-20130426/1196_1 /TAXON_ID=552665 /ORGANISM="Bigelowiella longifila, Strain CCMP242" /LENGTH=78 /DNA_ID=CAMNT_0027833965 /DNA_START=1334 /DNA_END=1567 /DNA_ORIENTATION=+